MIAEVQTSIRNMGQLSKSLICATLLIATPMVASADKTDDIVNSGLERQKAAAASQARIDEIADATDKVVSKYHQQRKVVDGLKIYNDRLRRTLAAQEAAKNKLEQSIEDASLIERQIVPLMMRMIEGLDRFVEADIPFKKAERQARVDRIRGYLTNANVSAAERFRQVLDAYSIENGYGQSIAVYTDTLSIEDENLTVNVLQVGRSGLYYQTLDGVVSGYWNKNEKSWKELDASFNEGINHAIRITQGKESKGLMSLPILAPEVL